MRRSVGRGCAWRVSAGVFSITGFMFRGFDGHEKVFELPGFRYAKRVGTGVLRGVFAISRVLRLPC